MSETFYIKRDDTSPAIPQQLLDGAGNPINLTGATVYFRMKRGSVLVIDAVATIVDALTGSVKYQWLPGDTANTGTHLIEWRVVFSGGSVETFPNNGFNEVEIGTNL